VRGLERTALTATFGAFIVPIFHFLYGEESIRYTILALIVLLIAMDWISGSRASKKDGSYASEYGIDGVFRTAFIIGLPAAGNLFDHIFHLPGIFFGLFSFGIIKHTLNSMTANVVRAGWDRWVPNRAIKSVESEIETKQSRALKRKQEREVGVDHENLKLH
jgi:phage-related holin